MTSPLASHRDASVPGAAVAAAAVISGIIALVFGRWFVGAIALIVAATWLSAHVLNRLPRTARITARLLLLPDPRVVSPIDRVTLASAAGLVALLVALFLPTWRTPPPLMPIYDDHEWTSLNIAAARAACGTASSTPDIDVAGRVAGRAVVIPIRDIAPFSCASVHPLVITQNTLMLTEAAVLRINPAASLATIARTLLALQFTGLAAFAVALCVAGVPTLWCALLVLGAHTLTAALLDQYMYAAYPLMIPAVAALIAIATIGARARSTRAHAAVAVLLGLAIGPIVNLRTDLLPVCTAIVGLWLLADLSKTRAIWQLLIIGAGVLAFQVTAIRPVQQAQPQRLIGHPVLHPIVLALAVPENPIASGLGLSWDDAVGFDLAHRIEPGVHVLTPDYERVLRRYYFGLWRERPGDMTRVYWLKFRAAARSIVVDSTGIGFDGQFWRAALRPLSVGTSGWPVPLLFAFGLIGGATASRRSPRSWVLPLTMLVAAGAINWFESVVVFSHFTPQYFGLAFVALIACCLVLYQVAWQCAWWPMTRAVFPK
jgi:hypothetical protein